MSRMNLTSIVSNLDNTEFLLDHTRHWLDETTALFILLFYRSFCLSPIA